MLEFLTVLAGLALLTLPSAEASAQSRRDCERDSISKIYARGKLIRTMNRRYYEVMSGDTITTRMWLPVTDILVCERSATVRGRNISFVEIINTDDSNEDSVSAIPRRCQQDSIRSVAKNGEIIITLSGETYEVLAGESITSSLWLPVSDLVICQHTVTHQGRGFTITELYDASSGDKVSAMRVR